VKIFRSTLFHTPQNPFVKSDALIAIEDGGLAIDQGKIAACGDHADVSRRFPKAEFVDWRGGYILPGFIDTHIHFPQTRILGGLGHTLLDWLSELALPEEARFADDQYAKEVGSDFVSALAAHGTTSALVFGAHFPNATRRLFDSAAAAKLRIVSGLVLSDALLPQELRRSPDAAYRESKKLIEGVRGCERQRYAVIPRFALSTSEAMLEVCGALLREHPDLIFTTHINENIQEIDQVRRAFPGEADYLAVYERFGLISQRSVLAHNVHATDSEIDRLASAGAWIAHCPCSNAALGSGIFRMRRHIERGAQFALGTDVGAGTGFGMIKEAAQAYLMQRVAAEPMTLTPAQMLYLATRAGAKALGIEDATGDLSPGKDADFVLLQPPKGTPRGLAALLTLADASWIRQVWAAGQAIHERKN
jgi:guanine deaminase